MKKVETYRDLEKAMNYKTLSIETSNKICTMKFNRPEKLNAFDSQMGKITFSAKCECPEQEDFYMSDS